MRSLFRLATAVAVLAPLAAASAPDAHAAAPWTPAQTAAGATPVFGPPALALGASGRGLLVAREAASPVPRRFEPFELLRVAPSGATADVGRTGGALTAGPVVFGRRRVVLVQARSVRPGSRTGTRQRLPRVRLTASFGTTDRPLAGRERTLAAFRSPGGTSFPLAAAANERGDVAVAWVEGGGFVGGRFEDSRLRLAVRRPNRGFSAPVTVARGYAIAAVSLAWGSGGDLVVAHNRQFLGRERRVAGARGAIEARVQRAGGALGPAQRIGPSRGSDRLSAAVAPNGRMVVAWGTNDPGEEVNEPFEVRAALRPAGPRLFRAPQLLDDGGGATDPGGVFGRVVARMAADGTATVAFTARRPATGPEPARERFVHPVLVATTVGGVRFGAPQQLAPEGALGDLAVAPDGTALAVWTAPTPGTEVVDPALGDVAAAVRPAGAPAFGPAEAVAAGEAASDPRVALTPDGGALAAWVGRAPRAQTPDGPPWAGRVLRLARRAP